MKKTYIMPSCKAVKANGSWILCGSVSSGKGIGYGGKDTNGSIIPSAHEALFDTEDMDNDF